MCRYNRCRHCLVWRISDGKLQLQCDTWEQNQKWSKKALLGLMTLESPNMWLFYSANSAQPSETHLIPFQSAAHVINSTWSSFWYGLCRPYNMVNRWNIDDMNCWVFDGKSYLHQSLLKALTSLCWNFNKNGQSYASRLVASSCCSSEWTQDIEIALRYGHATESG